MTSDDYINTESYQVEIPTDLLIAKVNNYKLEFWVLLHNVSHELVGFYTPDEKDYIIKHGIAEENTQWKPVTVKLKDIIDV